MTEQEILAYLERDYVRRVDMIEGIKRNRATVLYAEADAVLLKTRGWLLLLAADTVEAGVRALAHRDPDCGACVAHNEASRDAVRRVIPTWSHINACWQAYDPDPTIKPVPDVCEIRPFRKEDIPFLMEHYHTVANEAYFVERIEENSLFAGYRDGKLCAFIGFHDDGSGGMLEVLPEYRRLGIGSALETHLRNEALRRGWTPYGQIFVGNEPSRQLQRSLGMIVSDDAIYWMHPERE